MERGPGIRHCASNLTKMLSSEGAVVNTLGKVESHYVVPAESSFRVVGASIVIGRWIYVHHDCRAVESKG